MFGDLLRKNIHLLSNCSTNKFSNNAFWIKLRDIAVLDIIEAYPTRIDSDIAIDIYYQILLENKHFLPLYFREKLESNNQERFRVINRNMWSSNAFHKDGLANQRGIIACKKLNENRKGYKIIFEGVKR